MPTPSARPPRRDSTGVRIPPGPVQAKPVRAIWGITREWLLQLIPHSLPRERSAERQVEFGRKMTDKGMSPAVVGYHRSSGLDLAAWTGSD